MTTDANPNQRLKRILSASLWMALKKDEAIKDSPNPATNTGTHQFLQMSSQYTKLSISTNLQTLLEPPDLHLNSTRSPP